MAINGEVFRQFVRDELETRKLSNRQFAELAGISHTTVNRILDESRDKPYIPDVETLVKISSVTNVDISTLVAMIDDEYDPDNIKSRVLADKISRLPDERKAAIEALLAGFALSPTDNNS